MTIFHFTTGEHLILHCESAGPGSIRQTWLYNRKPIANEDLRVVVIEEGTKLLIASVDTKDTGSYTCQSDNVYGQSEWTAFVQVHCKYVSILNCLYGMKLDFFDA